MAPSGWLWGAAGHKVEHMPMPHPAARVDWRVPAQGVMHTIEGSLESGLGVFRHHYSPTFTVGPGRIIQHIPLGFIAAALEHTAYPPTNGWARAQIEIAGFSREKPWKPDAKTLDSLAHLLAALSLQQVAGIPLTRPFPDAMPPGPWAFSGFIRRRAGVWGRTSGWYGHVEIPQNSHWDPGALVWSHVLARARVIRAQSVKPTKPRVIPRPKVIHKAVRHRLAGGWRKVGY
jgi:hypothetical protein